MNNKPNTDSDFEKAVYDVLNIMRGYFNMEINAILILPQVFLFRFYELAKSKRLPKKFLSLNIEENRLKSTRDVSDLMSKLNNSDVRELRNAFTKFIREYEPLIGEEIFESIFQRLENVDYSYEKYDNEEFGNLYSKLIEDINTSSPHKAGHTSSKIIHELFSAIKIPKGLCRLYDPTFGYGNSVISFLKNQNKEVNVIIEGSEIDLETYSYASFNLICNGIFSFDLMNIDASELESKGKKYDIILADLPLKGQPGGVLISGMIDNFLSLLTKHGKACFVVSNNILYTSGDAKNKRKKWVCDRELKKIISLPEKVGRRDTNIPVSVLFFECGNKEKWVDFYSFDDVNEKNIYDETLLKKVFTHYKFDQEIFSRVDVDKVIDNDYDLLPKKYVGKIHEKVEALIEENKGIRLREVLNRETGNGVERNDLELLKDKYLKISDLVDDPFEYELEYDDISTHYENIVGSRVQKIEGRNLLVSNKGERIKPTLVSAYYGPVLVDRSISCYKINYEKIRPEYLMYQLHSDLVQEQIETVQKGITIPYLSVKDFLDIVIELPTDYGYSYSPDIAQNKYLDEKKKEAFEKLYRQKKKETEDLRKTLSITEDQEEEYRDEQEEELIDYINHNVRNKLSGVKYSIDVLYDFLKENEGKPIDLSALEGEPLTNESTDDLSTIDELFGFAKDGLNKALQTLKNLEDFRVDSFKKSELETVNILKWMKDYGKRKNRLKEYNIQVITKEEDENLFNINIVPAPFENVLDNLLENAEKHGFKGDLKTYSVLFELSTEQDYIIIDYKNDGQPLLVGLDKDRFITRGSFAGNNSGSGFGGFFINRTIEKLGGGFEIEEIDDHSQWNIHFKIKLKANRDNKYE